MAARQSALRAVGVESPHFSAGDDGRGLVQNQRGRLKAVEEVISARVHDVFLRVGHGGRTPPASILVVACREKEVTLGGVASGARGRRPYIVAIGFDVVLERVPGIAEVQAGEDGTRMAEVVVLEVQQLTVLLVRNR